MNTKKIFYTYFSLSRTLLLFFDCRKKSNFLAQINFLAQLFSSDKIICQSMLI